MRARVWFVLLAATLAATAAAADGEIEISHADALAGGLGGDLVADPPGYPVQITAPGSYRFTGDLSGAIWVEVGDVTIDLGGFSIRGAGNACEQETGIVGFQGANDVTIRNGRIRRMYGGIALPGSGARVERLQVDENCGGGITLGTHAIVDAVQARDNPTLPGIACGHFCRVSNSISYRNGDGILTGTDSIVTGSIAADNQTKGIESQPGSLVVHSASSLNGGFGIRVHDASNVIGSVANQNGSAGIALSTTSGAALNTIDGNVDGAGSFLGTPNACNVIDGDLHCPTP
ncbi:MAG: hypothetical protein DCC71_13310 [Proteobacteria bacterium]|nr:MAG: hypothetical protein DCC71_13310 [Pseudomonadota bacterium]